MTKIKANRQYTENMSRELRKYKKMERRAYLQGMGGGGRAELGSKIDARDREEPKMARNGD